MAIRIGTSGWVYRDWRGPVYPAAVPQRRWFELYASRFDTVEINASFYRLPSPDAVRGWHDQAPDGFAYAVKGSRYATHMLKLGGPKLPGSVQLITDRIRPMADRTAVVLWQLPPKLHRDVDRLARFAALLPRWARHAVEFRHPSWADDAVHQVLADHDLARVWVSIAGDPQPTVRTTDFCYLRFHGLGDDPYRWSYSDEELRPWADRLAAVAADGHDAFAYFNNDHDGHAVADAERLRALLRQPAEELATRRPDVAAPGAAPAARRATPHPSRAARQAW